MSSSTDEECQLISLQKVNKARATIPAFSSAQSFLSPIPPLQGEDDDEDDEDEDDDVQLVMVQRLKPPLVPPSMSLAEPVVVKDEPLEEEQPPAPPSLPSPPPPSSPQAPAVKTDPLQLKQNFPCPNCKRVFATSLHLVNHIESHHTIKKKIRKKEVLNKTYACEYCSTTFDKQVSLAAHLAVHKNEPGYRGRALKCKDCGEEFKSNGGLWSHKKKHHIDTLLKCGKCTKAFATQTAYEDHLKKHEESVPIQCHICQKSQYLFRESNTP